MKRRTHRRAFLRNSTLASLGLWTGARVASAAESSPNEKLNIGVIGVNHRGAANTNSVKSENIAALCDVDERYLAEAAKKFPAAKTYTDWRKLVDQKNLDAVVVSTTDHTHALASVWAMRRGLGVYCEKPLAHSVYEARVMRNTYKEAGVATQMGTQIHATSNYRRVVELIQSGAIGPVREVHVWCGRVGPTPDRPEQSQPVPDYLHWDLWIGPAPFRPYHSRYMPGCMTWEQWWDFGNGCIGDMGSHLIDLPFWALKLEHPTTAEAEGEPRHPDSYPNWLIAHWDHPAVGDRPALKLHWYDGVKRPKSPPGHDLNKWGIGVLFEGEKGQLLADYRRRILLPEDQFKDFEPPEPWIEPSPGQHAEWIRGCKTGAPTLCNFDYSGRLIENNLLATVAFRVNEKLQWDAENLKAVGCPEADPLIRREYRKGWVLEG
jgi:predicted dehydrogenase